MTITVTIRRQSAATPPTIRRVRKWGDPLIGDTAKLPASTGYSNFQVVKTATFGSDGKPFFNDLARYQLVDREFLESLQYASDGYTVKQKMNWLVNDDMNKNSATYERPYWTKGEPRLYFGPLVFGGQLVQLGESVTRNGVFPNEPTGTPDHPILFHRLVGMRRSQMAMGLTHGSHPHLIQRATEAGKNNVYIEYPRGEIFHPVWSDIDWPCNYGDGRLWVADAFLE